MHRCNAIGQRVATRGAVEEGVGQVKRAKRTRAAPFLVLLGRRPPHELFDFLLERLGNVVTILGPHQDTRIPDRRGEREREVDRR